MGYTTTFVGAFKIEPPLSYEHRAELRARIEDEEWPEVVGFPKPPNAYCQWRPTPDGSGLEWDKNEKFYDYEQWIAFLASYLKPKGYGVSGSVRFRGESIDDAGVLRIADGIAVKAGLTPGAWKDVDSRAKEGVLEAISEAAHNARDDSERDAFAAALAVLGAKPKRTRG